MVKSYLRYEGAGSFGVIVSVDSNIEYDTTGKHVLAAALEKVAVWHVRKGTCDKTLATVSSAVSVTSVATSNTSLVAVWHVRKGTCDKTLATVSSAVSVTFVATSNSSLIASGYADGSIRIWDIEKGTCETTLNGHKGAVTTLRYNKLGSMLASGSKDNDIILWDVVAEKGLFRLCGHRDQVTGLVFLDSGKKLVSSSKDKFLRVWDLEIQHCMQIVSGHHSEIWSIDTDPEERFVVTGSADPELRFYTVKHELTDTKSVSGITGTGTLNDKDSSAQNKWDVLKYFGEVPRQSKERVATVRFNKSGNLLACQAAGKIVEIFRVLEEAESKRKAKRRVNRKKEKKSAKGELDVMENGGAGPGSEENDHSPVITVTDVFKLLQTIRASKKICSISFSPVTPKNSLATLALSLNNNSLEFYSVESTSTTKASTIELQGHRSDVRSVTLSSDNTLLMSTSHSAVKIWNPSTGSCLRTIDSGYGLCGLFVPGNKFAVIGTKSGTLEIIDVGSATCVEVVKAHGDAIGSISSLPDGSGFISGSADHDIKFWDYKTVRRSVKVSEALTISQSRVQHMNADVVVVAVSPDDRYVAVAVLENNTIKILFMDSLKEFITLYGHKLPVLCMDISSDGDLLVSGSADKNLKIWGLDFGDCHKSIFAHADSVMAVRFVRNTHYMFSVGKDRLVKYWDADKFELLLTLEGHHAEIWCLTASNRGDFIVTGSHDRSIRRWDRTEEPFFIQEEKEKREEAALDAGIEDEDRFAPKEEIPEEGAVALAGKKTSQTVTVTDSILEALDMAEAELKHISEHQEEKAKGKVADFQPNIFMMGLSPSDYVLRVISNVHTNDLEQTLLVLPFSDALKLLSYLKDWALIPDKVELVTRVTAVLLQLHHNQLTTTCSTRPVLARLRNILQSAVKKTKDIMGYNLAGMDHLQQLMALESDTLFRDAKAKLLEIRSHHSKRIHARTDVNEERRKKKKQKKSNDGHVWS